MYTKDMKGQKIMTIVTKTERINLSKSTNQKVLNKVFSIAPNLRIQVNRCAALDGRLGCGNGYRVKLSDTLTGVYFNSVYNDSIANRVKNTADVNDILSCLLEARNCYLSELDLESFCNSLGYESYTEGKKAFLGCKRTSENLESIFTEEQLEQLNELFQEF